MIRNLLLTALLFTHFQVIAQTSTVSIDKQKPTQPKVAKELIEMRSKDQEL